MNSTFGSGIFGAIILGITLTIVAITTIGECNAVILQKTAIDYATSRTPGLDAENVSCERRSYFLYCKIPNGRSYTKFVCINNKECYGL